MTADGTYRPAQAGEVTITLPEYLDGLADGREVADERGVVWTATDRPSPTGRMWSSGGSALSSRGLLNGGPVTLRSDAPQPVAVGYDPDEPCWEEGCEREHDTDGLHPEAQQRAAAEEWRAVLDAPQPAMTDKVERAARAWHQAAEEECGGYSMGAWEAIDDENRDRARKYMRAALAAAGAGAEEWCTDPSCTRDAHDHSRRDGHYGD